MPRTAITPKVPHPGTSGAGDAKITFVAADTVSNNSFTSTGREVLLINNNTGSPVTVTVHSAPDPYGRTGDITSYSVPAGEIHGFGPFPQVGWHQNDGTIWVDVSGGQVAVIQVPSTP